MKTFTLVLAVAAAVSLSTVSASAQAQDPLVGSWNMQLFSGGSLIEIVIMNFNAGGTNVEYDTGSTNPSTSQSFALGHWSNTDNSTYTFKEENYIYNSGNLAYIAIVQCKLTLAQSQNSFTGKCTQNFYTCSLTDCPGSLVGTSPGTITGKRF
jgi:opacity protein-like surface antigen